MYHNRPTVSFSQARREPARAPGQTTFRAPSHPLPFPSPPLPLEVGPLIQLGVWGSAVSSPSGVWGGTPAEIKFGTL